MCGALLQDEPSFRRHLADAHGFSETSEQAAAPAPPAAKPTPTPPPTPPAPAPPAPEPPFVFDWNGPPTPAAAPHEHHEHPWREPSAFGLGLTTEAALAAGLVVAFVLPWFNAPGFLSSSGIGMLSWLPSRVHGVESVVPYLAVLIPLGALAVLVQWWRGEPTRTVATITGALAPVVLAYAVLRGQGLNLFKVLNVGAYLTIVLSVALLGVARGWWNIPLPLNRGEVSRRGLGSAGIALAVVIAALAVPVLAHQRTRAQVLAAFDLSAPATQVQSTAGGTQLDASRKAPASTDAGSATTIPSDGGTAASTDGGTAPAAAVPGAAAAGATTATSRRIIGATGSGTGSSSGSGNHAPATTQPKSTPPTTAAPAAGGCPSGRPTATVTSFEFLRYDDASGLYHFRVSGNVRNASSATVDLYSANLAYYYGSDNVDSGSVGFSGTLGPGQTTTWSLADESIDSPDGRPTRAAVTTLRYTWDDFDLSRCPK